MSSQTIETQMLNEIHTELKKLREELHQLKESFENYVVDSSSKSKSISDFDFERKKEETAWYHKFIDQVSDISDADAIIKGTQTLVSDVIKYSFHQDVVGILQTLPHLTREQIEAALVYYAHEPGLVSKSIRQKRTLQSYTQNEQIEIAWYHRYIDCVPGVCGGYPIIKGTRTPIRAIVEYSRSWNVIEIITNLPHLTQQQIHAALIYYIHEPELVDEDIKRNEEAWKELTSRPWRTRG
jgi:uncharacterized protein (DUF433 family)